MDEPIEGKENLEYATLGERILGWFIDYLFLFVLLLPLAMLPDSMVGGYFFVWMLVAVFHIFIAEGVWTNQTAGKYVLNMKVAKDDGSKAGIWNSLVRNIIGFLGTGWLGLLVGTVSILQSEENKRLGDSAAGTVVLKSE